MMATRPDYDVIIAGGGMVGSCLALALRPLGLRVAVVEAVARGAAAQPSFDDRSTALSRSSQRTFAALGLWQDILPAAMPIRHVHASDRGRFGFSHIDAAEQGVEALGYVVVNRVLGGVLQQALASGDGPTLHCPARIVAVTADDDRITATIDSSEGPGELTAHLLVAADGARSTVRDMVGIGARHLDYGQHAVIGNVRTARKHGSCAYERFTPDGPLAMLPATDDRVAFIWTMTPAQADAVTAMNDERFIDALQAAFGMRLGRFSRVGERTRYPLALSKANGLIANRSVLVGNAAHGLHPVAAQGFNLGLRDVAALSDCIADARRDGLADTGHAAILERYADWRRADQHKLTQFTDGLVRLFGSDRPAVRALRDIGMLGFDLVPGVRRLFARHTMGLAGKLPRLSRGVPLE